MASLLAFGTAWAQGTGYYHLANTPTRATELVANKDYVIFNTCVNGDQERIGFIYANDNNGLGMTVKNPSEMGAISANHVWTVKAGADGKYQLQSKSKGTYVGNGGSTTSTTGVDFVIKRWEVAKAEGLSLAGVNSKNDDGTKTLNASISATNNVWVISDGTVANKWWHANVGAWISYSSAHPFAFYEVTEFTTSESTQVTYTYTMGGKPLGTKTVTEFPGYAPTGQANVPVYVTASGFPAVVEENGNYTINTSYNAQLPFQVSTDEAPVYYRIRFDKATSYWYAKKNGEAYEGKKNEGSCSGLTLATEQDWKWQIVGDWFNGFNIKTQRGKYLSAKKTDTAAGVFPSGTDLLDAADAAKSYFLLEKYNSGWRFNLKGTKLNLAYTSSNNDWIDLYYAGGADTYIGGAVLFEKMGSFQTMIDELQATDIDGVGYPKADAAEYATLRATVLAKIAEIAAIDDNTFTFVSYQNKINELNTVINTLAPCTDVNMPEDGKAYTIVFQPFNKLTGTYRYLNFTGNGLSIVNMDNKDATIANSGVFVCRVMEGGKYAMVPAYASEGQFGKYLKFSNGTIVGVNSDWNTDLNAFTINPLVNVTSNVSNSADKSNRFGCVYFSFAQRQLNDEGVPSGNTGVFVIDERDGSFSGATVPFYNGTYTSAIIMKEVDYPSTVTLNAASNLDVDAIATFSAPYAAVVPTGVKAWYAESAPTDNKVTLTEVEAGKVIPAGQGVLLTGAAGEVTMAPATSETRAELTGNVLGNTAGAAKELTVGQDYILTSGNIGVAFYPVSSENTVAMNKAYLHTTGSGAPSLVLSFGDETDAIQAIESVKGQNAPIYDMQGRRVQKAVKGLYIQGGKKFMVK